MSITQDEMQSIITAVLSAIRTNSQSIAQLTQVTTLSDNDSFEIDGGKKVTYAVLRDLIRALCTTEHDTLKNLINGNKLKSVSFDSELSGATLLIETGKETLECVVPIATDRQSGIITATDKVNMLTAYRNALNALKKADTAQASADAAGSTANAAQESISALEEAVGTMRAAVALLTPEKVADEATMEAMIKDGTYTPGQIYYTEEED